jgi:hypothetical protein
MYIYVKKKQTNKQTNKAKRWRDSSRGKLNSHSKATLLSLKFISVKFVSVKDVLLHGKQMNNP